MASTSKQSEWCASSQMCSNRIKRLVLCNPLGFRMTSGSVAYGGAVRRAKQLPAANDFAGWLHSAQQNEEHDSRQTVALRRRRAGIEVMRSRGMHRFGGYDSTSGLGFHRSIFGPQIYIWACTLGGISIQNSPEHQHQQHVTLTRETRPWTDIRGHLLGWCQGKHYPAFQIPGLLARRHLPFSFQWLRCGRSYPHVLPTFAISTILLTLVVNSSDTQGELSLVSLHVTANTNLFSNRACI